MTNRSSRHMTAVLVVAVLLAVFAMACETRERSALSDASDEIRATVNDSDHPTPTRVTKDHPIESGLVSPISATFFPERQATEYLVVVNSPGDSGLWSDPSCGESKVDMDGHRMTCFHAHPPCDETTNHADEAISFKLNIATYRGVEDVLCVYQGSATGTGNPCVWTFF